MMVNMKLVSGYAYRLALDSLRECTADMVHASKFYKNDGFFRWEGEPSELSGITEIEHTARKELIELCGEVFKEFGGDNYPFDKDGSRPKAKDI